MKLVFILFAGLLSRFVSAEMKDDLFQYKRCYSQLVRERISDDNFLLKAISEKKLSGKDACLSLITYRNKKVLKTFQSLHRQWFPSYDLNIATQDYTATDFYDVNEMGYHLTNALFNSHTPFSSIVTNPDSFAGVRGTHVQPKFLYEDGLATTYERFGDRKWNRGDENNSWKPKLVSFGTLIALESNTGNKNFLVKNKTEHDANKSLGAGVIGTIPYILMNSGQGEKVMDGGLKVHRRWSKSILNDLLCRDLPVVKKEDALSYVDKKSPIAFRRKVECMQCHVSMDNFAGVIRNVELYNTDKDGFQRNTLRGAFVHKINPRSGKYFNQSTDGRILFRNYKDELIDAKFSNIADVGKWISTLDDFYVCSAKKYFSFFTGEDVDLLKKSDEKDFVVQLGLSLKKHQSARQLVSDIIESDYYKRR